MTEKSVVVVFCYSRPVLAARVIERVLAYQPKRLILVQDGLSNPEHEASWLETRSMLDAVDYPYIERLYAPFNLGLRDRFFSALDYVFATFNEAIILEDDTLPSPEFFDFMDAMLARFRAESEISIISGHNFSPVEEGLPYFFSKASYIWGWATWARVWNDFAPEERIRSASAQQIRDVRGTYASLFERWLFERMLKRLPSLGTWDVPFSYFLRKKGMLSVVSGRNLVVNLGVGDDATNTKKGLLGAFNIHQSKSEFSGPEEAPASYRKSVEQKMWQKRLRVAILSEAKIVLSSLSRSGKQ